MVGLHNLSSKHIRPKARVGRGGKRGKTSGRGMKGQKARAGHHIRPEMRDFIKKLPKLRGHGNNRAKTVNSARTRYIPVNLAVLEKVFSDGDEVTITSLIEKGIVSLYNGKKPAVKILAKGTLSKKLTIAAIPLSAEAVKAVESAGGSVKR